MIITVKFSLNSTTYLISALPQETVNASFLFLSLSSEALLRKIVRLFCLRQPG